MRRTVLLVLSAIFTAVYMVCPARAHAETPAYCRAVTKNVVFYKTPVTHYDYALFYLPYSYYLRVVEREGNFLLVEYQDNAEGFPKLYGYVEEASVSLEYQSPTYPLYPKETLTMIRSSYVFTQANLSADPVATALKDQTVRLYGRFTSRDGEIAFYYVKFGQVMGYVPADACSAPREALHPDEIVFPSDEPVFLPSAEVTEGAPDPSPAASGAEVLQIALIVAITVAVLVVVYTMFRPKKPADRFFDEEDE